MKVNAWTRWLLLSLIGLAAAAQPAIASSDSGLLTISGRGAVCVDSGGGEQIQSGFNSVLEMGAYSPGGLTGDTTVSAIFDTNETLCSSSSFAGLSVSGFASNPGSSWLTSITCNGVTNSGGTTNFAYRSGKATWIWRQLFGFTNLTVGASVRCIIVHHETATDRQLAAAGFLLNPAVYPPPALPFYPTRPQ